MSTSQSQQPQQPSRRSRFHCRRTVNGAVAISGFDRRNMNRETIMFADDWIRFSRFLQGNGFRTFLENNNETLSLRNKTVEELMTAPAERQQE